MAVNGRDLVKVTSAVSCIKPGDLVSYLASYALVLRQPAPILIYKIQNSFRRCFAESTTLPSAKYFITSVTANVFTAIPTKSTISLQSQISFIGPSLENGNICLNISLHYGRNSSLQTLLVDGTTFIKYIIINIY
jgi:hypothetical protein